MRGYRFLLLLALLCGTIRATELVQGASLFRHGSRYHLTGAYDGAQTKAMWG